MAEILDPRAERSRSMDKHCHRIFGMETEWKLSL